MNLASFFSTQFYKKRLWLSLIVLLPLSYFLIVNTPYSPDLFGEDFTKTDQKIKELRSDSELAVATVAGGCFWCMEAGIEPAEGVVEVVSGYAGPGTAERPMYQEVVKGTTKYREAAQIFFNPEIISYEEVLMLYWSQIDPTDPGGQFSDRGFHYTTAIYFHDLEQQAIAEESKQVLQRSGVYQDPIVTEIIPFEFFYPAEDYHQDYYKNNQRRYDLYAEGSGRKDYVRQGLLKVLPSFSR